MSSHTPADSIPEPKSPSIQDDKPPTRKCLTIAKLASSVLVFILMVITASIWPLHLHPVFISTLFTCFVTFMILIYNHTRTTSSISNRPYYVLTFLLLHVLPFVLWATCSVLTSLWTYTYHTTTWRSGLPLDSQKTYLADLPPGLTPAKIASDYFRRYRTVKYTAAVRMTGVCAGLASLTAILFVVSGVSFVRSRRQDRVVRTIELPRDRQARKIPGLGWLVAVVSRLGRKETLPMTENESKVKGVSTVTSFSEHGPDGLRSGAAPTVGGFLIEQPDGRDGDDELPTNVK